MAGNRSLDTRYEFPFSIEEITATIWMTRPDLRALCDGDRGRLDYWLLHNGEREYEAIREIGFIESHALLDRQSEHNLIQHGPRLTQFMWYLWESRQDLQDAFDIYDPAQQLEYIRWYFRQGVKEGELERYVSARQVSDVNSADPDFPPSDAIPITWLMGCIWRSRLDLQNAFDLANPLSHRQFLTWYFVYAPAEYSVCRFLDETQKQWLTNVEQETAAPWISAQIWRSSQEIQKAFPSPAHPVFQSYLDQEGGKSYPILAALKATAREAPAAEAAGPETAPGFAKGVNLVGYARGELGIGEDVRMAALAMEAAGIPFSIYNIEPGNQVDQNDHTMAHHISDRLPYDTSIFCMTGFETARLAAIQGSKLFQGRRNIGHWPWELADWPAEWCHAYKVVDEVWASSQFTYSAYAKNSPVPVRHVPMAVSVDVSEQLRRADFGLPQDAFLFVFSFDVLSSYERKNPKACVDAFLNAFPGGDEPVGLVVKVMRADQNDPEWQSLKQRMETDPRIVIVNETLSRGAVLDLYRACDCFLSLHRSEGFGRGIAEAMMLGKPVIITGYSGNMDYTSPDSAAIVPFQPVIVGEDAYEFAGGQIWADPDIKIAAAHMRRLFEDLEWRNSLAENGRNEVISRYGHKSVAKVYQMRFGSLAK